MSSSQIQQDRLAKLEEWKRSKAQQKSVAKSTVVDISSKNTKAKSVVPIKKHPLKPSNSTTSTTSQSLSATTKPTAAKKSTLSSQSSRITKEKPSVVTLSATTKTSSIRTTKMQPPPLTSSRKPSIPKNVTTPANTDTTRFDFDIESVAVKVEQIIQPITTTQASPTPNAEGPINVKQEIISQPDDVPPTDAAFQHPAPVLTVDKVVSIAQANGDQTLVRALFEALKSPNPVASFTAPDGGRWNISGSECNRYEFWSNWAKFEETGMDVIKAIDVLNEGIDFLILQEDLVKLKVELSLLDLRFGEKYAFPSLQQDDDEEQVAGAHRDAERNFSLPSSKYLESHDYPDIDDEDEEEGELFALLPKPEPIVKEEKVGNSTMDLVNLLSEMKLDEKMAASSIESVPAVPTVKMEPGLGLGSCGMSPPRKGKAGMAFFSQQQLKVGVPVGYDTVGSTVTVLTPVRAKNRLKKGCWNVIRIFFTNCLPFHISTELGVDTVITPVRRSLRFHGKSSLPSTQTVLTSPF